MIRLSYSVKCLFLGLTFYAVFYFLIVPSAPSFSKYVYFLAVSTLLFPIAKRLTNAAADSLAPNVVLFGGLLTSLLITIIIWILTPFIILFALVVFSFYGLNILKKNLVG